MALSHPWKIDIILSFHPKWKKSTMKHWHWPKTCIKFQISRLNSLPSRVLKLLEVSHLLYSIFLQNHQKKLKLKMQNLGYKTEEKSHTIQTKDRIGWHILNQLINYQFRFKNKRKNWQKVSYSFTYKTSDKGFNRPKAFVFPRFRYRNKTTRKNNTQTYRFSSENSEFLNPKSSYMYNITV